MSKSPFISYSAIKIGSESDDSLSDYEPISETMFSDMEDDLVYEKVKDMKESMAIVFSEEEDKKMNEEKPKKKDIKYQQVSKG